MTCATTAPIWLFISVTPHLLDAVLSDLNGLSLVLNDVISGSSPIGDGGQCEGSAGGLSSSSARMPVNRLFTVSSASSKRGGRPSGWDHSGCSLRAAARL